MTPNPILKVLSTFKKYNVKCLLIGGQACIIYGAAEFSRDSDFVILCNNENLQQLKKALNVLKAKLIYVPPLEVSYLERGHACHFRCKEKSVENLRIDVISKLRGCEPFEKLWELSSAINSNTQKLNLKLHKEEIRERQKDIEYWAPLRKELEALRHNSQEE